MLLNTGWMRREGKSQAAQGCSVMVAAALKPQHQLDLQLFLFPSVIDGSQSLLAFGAGGIWNGMDWKGP